MDFIDYKKIYILDNINIIENHNKIVNFINYHEIKHTENSNGYFVNISVLSEELIEILYKLIYDLNNNNDNLEKEKNKITEINLSEELNINSKKIIKKEYNDIKLCEFSGKDKELIILSKNYKFE